MLVTEYIVTEYRVLASDVRQAVMAQIHKSHPELLPNMIHTIQTYALDTDSGCWEVFEGFPEIRIETRSEVPPK